MEVQESSGEVPAHHWNKIKPKVRCIKEGYRNISFHLCDPFPRWHSSVPKETLTHDFFHKGEWEYEIAQLPSYVGHHQRDPVLSHHAQSTGVCCMTGEWEAAGKTVARGLGALQEGNGILQRNIDPTNCAADHHESLGNPPMNSPN